MKNEGKPAKRSAKDMGAGERRTGWCILTLLK